jgi:ubiquinone/menaquinone biosynthesis C-methylase UbiE
VAPGIRLAILLRWPDDVRMARIDYDTAAEGYAQSRALSLEAMDSWREAVAAHLPDVAAPLVVDVGSGTGSFACAFAEWFAARVIGLEASEGMLAQAKAAWKHERVRYVRGDAERLPLRSAICDVAWLSTVIHHFRDLDAAAREIRRVVRPGGVALVRSSFPGRHEGITLFRRFPGASRVASSFPTVEATEAAFSAAGFRLDGIERVPQVSAPSLRVFLERVRLRADTTLTLMPDDEFDAGVAALERDVAAEAEPRAVVDYLDLLTFV